MGEVHTDIALFIKGGKLALLALAANDERGVIIQADPRSPSPQVAMFDNYFKAVAGFDKAVETSIERGWRCFHRGKPNVG